VRNQVITMVCGLVFLTQCACAPEGSEPLPAWVNEAVADQQASRGRPMKIDDCTYEGKRVFLFTRLDVAEASDADTLFRNDGKPMCKFGEFSPPGAPRACDFKKLACRRTLHPAR
jgi:hypothetical protein